MSNMHQVMGAVLEDLKNLNLVVEAVYQRLFELQRKKLDNTMDDKDLEEYREIKEIVATIKGRVL